MKAVVESIGGLEVKGINAVTFIFMKILQTITEAQSVEELRERMRDHFTNNFEHYGFSYGFGGNHMWVTHNKSKERLIFVSLSK